MRSPSVFGSFVAADTAAARVDARVKLVLLLAATVGAFLAGSMLQLACWYVALAVAMRAARIDVRAIARLMRPVALILAFTLVANALALDGHGDISIVGPIGIDTAGALRGAMAVLRIGMLVGAALVVSASTTPPELSAAVVRLMRPLVRLGVPVADIGLVLSLALRFIPIVSEELSRIQLAQRGRGVRFDEGGVVDRVRAWASVLTPLVVSLFRRADRLGESMAARCYADGAMASWPARALARRDVAVLVLGLGVCVALTCVGALL